MPLSFGQPQNEAEHHPHHNRRRLQKLEGGIDLLIVAMIIVLGLAMIIGLMTASGNINV